MDESSGIGSLKQMEFIESFERAVQIATRSHTILEGSIQTVDEETFTCTVTVGDSVSSVVYDNVYFDVLTIGNGSFICIPAVGSACILAFRNGSEDRRQLLKCWNYEQIIAAPTTWQFNKGENGGLPMVNPLVEKINALENLINDFIIKFNTHTHNVTATGSPTGPSLLQENGTIAPITKATDLENPNVTQ